MPQRSSRLAVRIAGCDDPACEDWRLGNSDLSMHQEHDTDHEAKDERESRRGKSDVACGLEDCKSGGGPDRQVAEPRRHTGLQERDSEQQQTPDSKPITSEFKSSLRALKAAERVDCLPVHENHRSYCPDNHGTSTKREGPGIRLPVQPDVEHKKTPAASIALTADNACETTQRAVCALMISIR
jgi:hypothetical protein